jgi:hypothetical protein
VRSQVRIPEVPEVLNGFDLELVAMPVGQVAHGLEARKLNDLEEFLVLVVADFEVLD